MATSVKPDCYNFSAFINMCISFVTFSGTQRGILESDCNKAYAASKATLAA